MKFLTRNWFKKLTRDFLQQKLLFFTLVILCTLGIGSYIALTMGFTNLSASYNLIYKNTRFADAELSTQSADIWFNISEIQNKVKDFISFHPEIQSVNYRLIVKTGYNISSLSEDSHRNHYTEGRVIGIDTKLEKENRINDLIFESGNYFNESSQNNSILVEAHFAHYFRLKTGNQLVTRLLNKEYNFTISGIVYSPEYLIVIPSRYDFLPSNRYGVIYLPIDQLQTYTNLTGLANNLIIKMKPSIDISIRDMIITNLTQTLNQFTDGSFAPPVFQENQVSNWALRLDLEEIEEIALILPVIVLGVAVVSLYIVLGRMVQSQRQIIGIASSLGYLPRDILFHYITLTIIISGFGTVFGVLFGAILSGGVTWVYAYYMGFPNIVLIEIQPQIVLTAILVGFTVSVMSGAIPSWNASRLLPRETLQTSVSIEKGQHSILEKMLIFNPFGFKLTIPIRNLFRRKIRTFATIVAISAAVMILVVSLAFIESVSSGVNRQFYETTQYDIIIKYEGLKFADLGVKEDIAFLRNIPNVKSVEPVLQIPSIMYVNGVPQEVLITAFNSTQPSVHNFQWSNKQDSLTSLGSVVICSALSNQYNIETGDAINYSYPQIPGLNDALWGAEIAWNANIIWGDEVARNETLLFLEKQLNRSKESFSLSEIGQEVRHSTAQVKISGVSKEIWGGFVYTHVKTITNNTGLDIFKQSFINVDLTPYSQIILRVTQPNDVAILEEIKQSIIKLDGIRSIEFGYDLNTSISIMMGAFNAIVGIFLVFACLLAVSAIFTAIYVNLQERQREIATMIVSGLSDSELLFMVSIENVINGLLGISLGIPLGLWVASWLLDNILRIFYFPIIIHPLSWLILWIGVIILVLISQFPAVNRGVKLDLSLVTKELST
ncbi:MAG: ABC transporter permease [Candidatus Hodarchaeota archaeon]